MTHHWPPVTFHDINHHRNTILPLHMGTSVSKTNISQSHSQNFSLRAIYISDYLNRKNIA